MEKVVFILGPTGVGKSDMAISLAKEFNGEIISADSVQIFKGFNIGSAKVTEKEMKNVPHHLIDICNANDYFTVSDFVNKTREKISDIAAREKLPIIVGGTGLYITALLDGYNFGGTEKHELFRENVRKEIEEMGHLSVWNKLNLLAPNIAEKIEPNNTNRLIRGLEIATFGGGQEKQATEYDYLIFSLNLERQMLYSRINSRVDTMLEKGLIQEVQSLLKSGAEKNCQPMKAIGYKEVVEFLDGNMDKETLAQLIKQHSRNYAKRQLTYLRGLGREHKITSIDVSNNAFTIIKEKVKEWL